MEFGLGYEIFRKKALSKGFTENQIYDIALLIRLGYYNLAAEEIVRIKKELKNES